MGKPRKKTTSKNVRQYQKEIARIPKSNDKECPIWVFSDIDKDGEFRFAPSRTDFDAKDFLNKIISFSTMTWAKIILQTHDNGKSKHHILKGALSKEAEKRIAAKKFEDLRDHIFSFFCNRRCRYVSDKFR